MPTFLPAASRAFPLGAGGKFSTCCHWLSRGWPDDAWPIFFNLKLKLELPCDLQFAFYFLSRASVKRKPTAAWRLMDVPIEKAVAPKSPHSFAWGNANLRRFVMMIRACARGRAI
jgi:hypothetical protein